MYFREHRGPLQPTVYQVTRQGHEHCDVTDGTLLDITPLDEGGAKLFTLYDKDLNEGVNLFIGASSLWFNYPTVMRSKCSIIQLTCPQYAIRLYKISS